MYITVQTEKPYPSRMCGAKITAILIWRVTVNFLKKDIPPHTTSSTTYPQKWCVKIWIKAIPGICTRVSWQTAMPLSVKTVFYHTIFKGLGALSLPTKLTVTLHLQIAVILCTHMLKGSGLFCLKDNINRFPLMGNKPDLLARTKWPSP